MKKILFSHSYFLRFDPKQWKNGRPYPPLGTIYAAALMRENGYNVSLFDTMFAADAYEVINEIEKYQPEYFVLYDDGFNYLTKMCLTNMREAAFRMSKLAKERGCTVIISSSDSTDHAEKYLKEGADFILAGEAELSLLELVNAIEKTEKDFSLIQGIVFKNKNDIVKTQRRTVLKFLDGLPFPAWDILDIEPYKKMWLKHAGYFSLNMATTRGCPFKCNWCAKPIYGNRYNSRSPENVIEEIKMLQQKFDVKHFWFCDDIFGLKPNWVNEFANLTEKENLHFRFKIQARADLLLQENYVKALSRAGCDNIWMGAESGSQKILDAMDKGITVGQIYEATKLIRKYNMKPSFFIQFGYIGETKYDIEKTIKMINELLPYNIGISVSYPLPGTKFYEKVKTELTEKCNWADSDEMMLMFRNTYQPAYYKQLYKYVHKTYQKHLAVNNFKKIFSKKNIINFSSVKKAMSVLYYAPSLFFAGIKIKRLEKITANE